MYRCTVVIPTFNRMELLKHTLESLRTQQLPRDHFEVIVVDDGSSDDTKELVLAYENCLNIRYFFKADEGFRVAAARNIGISHATSDICIFIDAGVILHSACLSAHVECHEASKKPLAVCGYVYCFARDDSDADKIRRTVDFGHPDNAIESMQQRRIWLDLREGFYQKYGDDIQVLPAPWLMYWTCNASARTCQLRSIGMFDEAFQSWGAEDVDLGYRLHRDGARLIINRRATAIHYPHPKDADANRASAANNLRYMGLKYSTPITMLLAESKRVDFMTFNDMIRDRGLAPIQSKPIPGSP